jgi:hypothetical protein
VIGIWPAAVRLGRLAGKPRMRKRGILDCPKMPRTQCLACAVV